MKLAERQDSCVGCRPVERASSVEHLQEKRGGRIAVDLGCLVHGRARPSMREAGSLQLSCAGIELACYSETVDSAQDVTIRLCQGL